MYEHDYDSTYPFQFRAFSDVAYKRPKNPKTRRPMSGRNVLIDDTETTTDFTQRLLFGSGRLLVDHWDEHTLTCKLKRIVLYYADDLPEIRPLTFTVLQEVANESEIELVSHTEYLRRYLLTCGQSNVTSKGYQQGTLVFFNASFDMFRHGSRVTNPGRSNTFFKNGVGCQFLDEPWAPWYRETRMGIGARRELTRRQTKGQTWYPPVIVDLAQMTRAMTGKPQSLLTAGEAFKCDVLKFNKPQIHDPEVNFKGNPRELKRQIRHYVEYNLRDVEATADLYQRVMTRFYRHSVNLRPEDYISAASLDKAYMRAMGIHPAFCTCEDCKNKRGAWKVPKIVLGLFMGAFLGARSEAGARLESWFGALHDWRSMYPAVMHLSGDWDFRIAEHIEVREETEAVQEFLDKVTLEDLFKPETWRIMRGVAEHRGDCLIPVRTKIGEVSAIATKHVPEIDIVHPPMVSAIRDLVASKIRTGRTPKILSAYRPYPVGKQKTLRPVRFAGRVEFDPVKDNWYQFLVNTRAAIKAEGDPYDEQLAYKETVNADYGISAEMNLADREAEVYGLGGQSWKVGKSEVPGEYANPLLACDITAGARLMLAMFQVLAGNPILCDTDSFATRSTPDGSEGLSWQEVNEIAQRFDSLNPWDTRLISHLIDWQYPAPGKNGIREPIRITAISAKRYSLYGLKNGKLEILAVEDGDETDDSIEIVKRSEHGLGLYLNPFRHSAALADEDSEHKTAQKRFYDEVWTWGLQTYVFGRKVREPDWFDLPAVARFPIRTQFTYRMFDDINDGLPYYDQIIPGSFFLTVHRSRSEALRDFGTERAKLQLIAPFNPDPRTWLDLPWMDAHTGRRYRITTDYETADSDTTGQLLVVKSYREVIREYFNHPELKYDGPDGKRCGSKTRGQLQPGIAIPESYEHISKDGSYVNSPSAVFEHRGPHVFDDDSGPVLMGAVREILRLMGYSSRDVERSMGLTQSTAVRFMNGRITAMRQHNWRTVLRETRQLVEQDLKAVGYWSPRLRSNADIFRLWKKAVESSVIKPGKQPIRPLAEIVPEGFKLVAEDAKEDEI